MVSCTYIFTVVKFQVLTAASMKIRAFWYIALCSFVGYADVSEVSAASIKVMIIHDPDGAGSIPSETSVYSNETTRRYILEGSHLYLISCFIERNTHGILFEGEFKAIHGI
jgi:hypothetical protein